MGRVVLADIAGRLGGELVGEGSLPIDAIASLESAGPTALSFIASPRYLKQLERTRAGAVITSPALRDAAAARGAAIVVPDPYLAYARITQWWAARLRPRAPAGIHPSAVVDPSAELGEGASIGPLAVVEGGAVIGAGAEIGAQCFVGAAARIGAGTRLAPRVVLSWGCSVGERGILHSGLVVGADGFGFAPDAGRWEKIEQLGCVRIGDDVEIGANTCIDRGALDDTVIEDGVKLDDQIMVAHNVRIGAHTAMAGCVGIAGSAVIGAHCTIGGAAMILGHLTIADHVHVSAAAVVMRSLLKPGHYSGSFPIDDNASWEKNAATLRQLYSLRERIRTLEKNTP